MICPWVSFTCRMVSFTSGCRGRTGEQGRKISGSARVKIRKKRFVVGEDRNFLLELRDCIGSLCGGISKSPLIAGTSYSIQDRDILSKRIISRMLPGNGDYTLHHEEREEHEGSRRKE